MAQVDHNGTLAKPRHATQPDGKLVPATVEIDEEGNPVFFYSEATPQKLSPRIVTPRSILNRLSMKRGSVAATFTHTDHPGDGAYVNNNNNSNAVVCLHQSMMLDEQSLTAFDEDDENRSVHSVQSFKSKGSLTSLTKLKSRLRRSRKKNKKQSVDDVMAVVIPLQQNHHHSQNKLTNDGNKQPSLSRRSSHTESTESVTSRASSVGALLPPETQDMEEESSFAALPMACDPNSSFFTVSEATSRRSNLEIKTTDLHEDGCAPTATPPPVATLKDVMEKAGITYPGTNNSRRSSAPAMLVQKPKNKNLVSVVKSSANATNAVVAAAVRPSSTTSAASQTKQVVSRPPSTKSSASSVASVSSTSSNHPENANFKIFLLLLHPTSKIFELIQLFFNPTTTTIRDVLYMIPTNATEPALGAQDYTGLCRPSTEEGEDEEISNLDLLVQNHDNMKFSAQVVRGEVLVAVPIGYGARKVAALSRQILVNPRIRRLLESDSEANTEESNNKKKKAKKSSRKTSTSSRRRRRSSASSPRSKPVECVEQRDDQESTHTTYIMESSEVDGETSMMSVQRAMEKAASAAAAANAAVHELQQLPRHRGKSLVAAAGKTYRYPHGRNTARVPNSPADSAGTDESMSLESALKSLDNSTVATKSDYSRTDASENSYSLRSYEYLDTSTCSYSWSHSLDNSFAARRLDTPIASALLANHSMNMSMMSTNTTAVRRRNKNKRIIRRASVVAVALMVATYFVDGNGFASRNDRVEGMLQQPMRLTGLIQVIGIFIVFVKLQSERLASEHSKIIRRTNKQVSFGY